MITATEQTSCKDCGQPIVLPEKRGPHPREFCNATCRQRWHRKQRPSTRWVTMDGTIDEQAQQAIAELEQRNAELEALREQAEQGRDQVQQGFREYVRTINEKISEQCGELDQYRQIADLMDRAKMEARFMHLGEQTEYHDLMEFTVFGGYSYWHSFMKRANDETLLKAIATAEYFLDGLIALRGDPRERRITELEREKKDLEVRLDFEERFLTDTRKRDFKRWLRSHPQPTDTDFFKCFLDDREMPGAASRAMYEAKLDHGKNYSAEDILLFKDAWRRMLFSQP